MKVFSRRALVEERKNIKKAYFYIFLLILFIIFLIIFGLPTLIKFAGFVGDLAKSDKAVEVIDVTPPAPPQIDSLPEYTNKESIEINGISESGASVIISANGNESEVIANNEGKFVFIFNLLKGDNTISLKAKDFSGNISNETKVYRIVFDDTEPKLEILSPKDGDKFYSANQKQITIKGTVDKDVDLRINGKFVSVKDDGTFDFTTTLNDGTNSFEVKAKDLSGNESVISLSFEFIP